MVGGAPELVYEDFVQARSVHWKSDNVASQSPAAPLDVGNGEFLLYSPGPADIFAVFEQNGHRGCFYVYDGAAKQILRSAQIYDRAAVAVAEDEIDVGWAADDSVCGLAVFGQFRAFLGVKKNLEMRKLFASAESPGFPETEWPAGFEHYRENRPE